jgi:hypothetical protein
MIDMFRVPFAMAGRTYYATKNISPQPLTIAASMVVVTTLHCSFYK